VTSVRGCPVHIPPERQRAFNYATDPKKADTPFDAYLAFRDQPAFWSTETGGFWVLTDAESVREAYQNTDLFSSRNIGLGYTGYPEVMIPEQLDPPEHRKYRSLLASWFTPNTAKRLEPVIRQICGDIIDSFIDEGSADLIPAFLGRFPQTVFLQHIIHLPISELEQFLYWEHQMLRHPQVPENAAAAGQELRAYLATMIAERAVNPLQNDLISDLLTREVDERAITQREVGNIAYLLFLAGLDTVTTALAHSFYFLATHPGHRAQMLADTSEDGIIPSAVEELLRYHAFVNPVRTANFDTDFHGIPLKRDDKVLVPSVLAGRDASEFSDPDEVRFDRPANRHIAFGAGPHRCLGSHLARIELKVAMQEFHKRVSDYELQDGVPVTYHAAGVIGLDNVPVRWTKRA
jgi:cytochrome P450